MFATWKKCQPTRSTLASDAPHGEPTFEGSNSS
jgi:hypothetical protein